MIIDIYILNDVKIINAAIIIILTNVIYIILLKKNESTNNIYINYYNKLYFSSNFISIICFFYNKFIVIFMNSIVT